MKKLAYTLIGVLFITSLQAQKLIKCDENTTYWAIADGKTNYVLQLSGKVQTTSKETLIAVDTKALQYLLLDKKPYEALLEEKSDLELLIAQATRELEFFSG